MNELLAAKIKRLQLVLLIMGAVSAGLSSLGALLDRAQFFQSYLVSYMFFLGLGLGSLGIMMLHHVVGGRWGFVARRLAEAGAKTLPVLFVLFIPVLLGIGDLYIWSHADEVAKDEILTHKAPYLNTTFFIARAVAYFCIWSALAFLLGRWSTQQAQGHDTKSKMSKLSAPGIILYGLTMSFAAVDWVMSIDPHWYSTLFGLMFVVGQILSTLAFVLITLYCLRDDADLSAVLKPVNARFRDLGGLLFAFIMLWGYMNLSQFLIIWSGNLPEEVPWYLRRTDHGWLWIIRFILLGHFALPFFLLLNKQIKGSPKILVGIAVWILVMRVVDLHWIITPSFGGHGAEETAHGGSGLHWLHLTTLLSVGGFWLCGFLAALRRQALVVKTDHWYQEAIR